MDPHTRIFMVCVGLNVAQVFQVFFHSPLGDTKSISVRGPWGQLNHQRSLDAVLNSQHHRTSICFPNIIPQEVSPISSAGLFEVLCRVWTKIRTTVSGLCGPSTGISSAQTGDTTIAFGRAPA